MACRHFVDGRPSRCLAVRGPIVPSLEERELFCRSGSVEACRTYAMYSRGDSPLPLVVYYALWALPRLDEEDAETTRQAR